MFGRFAIVARNFGRPICFEKKMKKTNDISSGKNRVCLRFPKESDRLLNPD